MNFNLPSDIQRSKGVPGSLGHPGIKQVSWNIDRTSSWFVISVS